MEVISSLCFGQDVVPEHQVIDKLLKIIFVNKQTSRLTYKKKGKLDQNPIIRSALLQLLLKYRYFLIIHFFKWYYHKSLYIETLMPRYL